MSTEEKQQLLNAEEKKGLEPSHSLGNGSKMNETMLIFAMLFINVLVVCVDTMPETFFNYEAKRRGLKEYQNGIVIGCYDFGRLIAGPVCPFMVSIRSHLIDQFRLLIGMVCRQIDKQVSMNCL